MRANSNEKSQIEQPILLNWSAIACILNCYCLTAHWH